MHTHEHQSDKRGQFNFRCADAGRKSWDWQVNGNSEEEIMPKIEQHGREKHNMKIDDETKRRATGLSAQSCLEVMDRTSNPLHQFIRRLGAHRLTSPSAD